MSRFIKIAIITTSLLFSHAGFLPIAATMKAADARAKFEAQADFLLNEGEISTDKVLVQYHDQEKAEFSSVVIEDNVSEEQPLGEVVDLNEIKPEQVEQVSEVKQEITQLLSDPNVKSVQPNYVYQTTAWSYPNSSQATPADYSPANHWYNTLSKLPEMWRRQNCPSTQCGGSNSIVVAVIDTGLAYKDFTGKVINNIGEAVDITVSAASEYDNINLFVNSGEIAGDLIDNDSNGIIDDINGIDTYAYSYSWLLADENEGMLKAINPIDTFGHGTFVTGMIAAEVDNGSSLSPAFKTSIMPIAANRHFTRDFTTETIALGINYATAKGADIINMSLGGNAGDDLLKDAIDNAYAQGVLLVAAAGNEAGNQMMYPARYDNVIAVGAINPDNSRSNYSNYGTGLNVMAYVGQTGLSGGAAYQQSLSCYQSASTGPGNPAGCDPSDIGGGHSNKFSTGTSFAAPQVAALAAILKAKEPTLPVAELTALIYDGATDINTPGADAQTGRGVINYENSWLAVDAQQNDGSSPVYRFLHKGLKIHFYTAGEWERNFVQTQLSSIWQYEGVGYRGFTTQVANTIPVYRFLHRGLKIHFYTSGEGERNFVQSQLSSIWQYEGVAYYAYPSSQNGSTPLYRFLHKGMKIHFYTAGEGEKNFVQSQLSSIWQYEGVGYYVK